jgi:hypothetical protein
MNICLGAWFLMNLDSDGHAKDSAPSHLRTDKQRKTRWDLETACPELRIVRQMSAKSMIREALDRKLLKRLE